MSERGGAAGRASELVIAGLRAGIPGREILQGVDIVIRSGEVHALMGPNGSGKSTLSHVLMGRPDYQLTGGSITLDGTDLLHLHIRWGCPASRSEPSSAPRWVPTVGTRTRSLTR